MTNFGRVAMKRAVAGLACASLVLGMAHGASAHLPGSDGGPAQRSCGVLSGVSQYGAVGVGASGVSCSIARQVARGSVRGQSFERWRCTGRRTRFGHCHGRGVRAGGVVHWYADH